MRNVKRLAIVYRVLCPANTHTLCVYLKKIFNTIFLFFLLLQIQCCAGTVAPAARIIIFRQPIFIEMESA